MVLKLNFVFLFLLVIAAETSRGEVSVTVPSCEDSIDYDKGLAKCISRSGGLWEKVSTPPELVDRLGNRAWKSPSGVLIGNEPYYNLGKTHGDDARFTRRSSFSINGSGFIPGSPIVSYGALCVDKNNRTELPTADDFINLYKEGLDDAARIAGSTVSRTRVPETEKFSVYIFEPFSYPQVVWPYVFVNSAQDSPSTMANCISKPRDHHFNAEALVEGIETCNPQQQFDDFPVNKTCSTLSGFHWKKIETEKGSGWQDLGYHGTTLGRIWYRDVSPHSMNFHSANKYCLDRGLRLPSSKGTYGAGTNDLRTLFAHEVLNLPQTWSKNDRFWGEGVTKFDIDNARWGGRSLKNSATYFAVHGVTDLYSMDQSLEAMCVE